LVTMLIVNNQKWKQEVCTDSWPPCHITSRINKVLFHSESFVTNFHEHNMVALQLNIGQSMFTIKRLGSTVQCIHKIKLFSSYKKRYNIIGLTYQVDELTRQFSAWKLTSA
jgi:hypothetical protein